MSAPWTDSHATLERAVERLASREDLDPVADRIASSVRDVLDGAAPRSTLSGTFAGHPLHPVLTDAAIGLLHSATFLDVLVPTTWARRAATTLLAAGLVASVPTALTGLHDWSDTSGGAKRVGLVHGATNGVGTVFYALSLVSRLRGNTFAPRVWSVLGYLTLFLGAFLGGHLTYRKGVGVDHTLFREIPGGWQPTVPLDDLPEQQLHKVSVGEVDLAVFKANGRIYAVADRCSHLGGPLSEGHVHEDSMEVGCPWHHSMFRFEDGEPTRGPATAPQPTYETRVVNGVLEVRSRA